MVPRVTGRRKLAKSRSMVTSGVLSQTEGGGGGSEGGVGGEGVKVFAVVIVRMGCGSACSSCNVEVVALP